MTYPSMPALLARLTPTPLTPETLHVAVLAALGGDEEEAQRVLTCPGHASAFVPPPAELPLDPAQLLPEGRYAILVVQGHAEIVRTMQPWANEQQVSVPVANAGVLHPLASYVMRSAGGSASDSQTGEPRWYALPDWLACLIEPS